MGGFLRICRLAMSIACPVGAPNLFPVLDWEPGTFSQYWIGEPGTLSQYWTGESEPFPRFGLGNLEPFLSSIPRTRLVIVPV